MVPSSGSTYQRYSEPLSFPAALFGLNGVRWEILTDALDNELFRRLVGLRHQIEFGLQLKAYAALVMVAEQISRSERNLDRSVQMRRHSGLRDLVEILDVVLEDEQVRRVFAGDADEPLVVVLDRTCDQSLSASLTQIGILRSIRCFRYRVSSNVCSTGRAAFPFGAGMLLRASPCFIRRLLRLFRRRFLWSNRLVRHPYFNGLGLISLRRGSRGQRFSIVSTARRDVPRGFALGACRLHCQLVKTIRRERHIVGIKAEQILGTRSRRMPSNALSISAPRRRMKYLSAGSLRQRGESIFSADITPRVVGDGHDQDRINHGIGQLRRFGGAIEGVGYGVPPSVTTISTLRPWPILNIARRQQNRVVQRGSPFAVE